MSSRNPLARVENWRGSTSVAAAAVARASVVQGALLAVCAAAALGLGGCIFADGPVLDRHSADKIDGLVGTHIADDDEFSEVVIEDISDDVVGHKYRWRFKRPEADSHKENWLDFRVQALDGNRWLAQSCWEKDEVSGRLSACVFAPIQWNGRQLQVFELRSVSETLSTAPELTRPPLAEHVGRAKFNSGLEFNRIAATEHKRHLLRFLTTLKSSHFRAFVTFKRAPGQ